MTTRKKRLGRGLEALLGASPSAESSAPKPAPVKAASTPVAAPEPPSSPSTIPFPQSSTQTANPTRPVVPSFRPTVDTKPTAAGSPISSAPTSPAPTSPASGATPPKRTVTSNPPVAPSVSKTEPTVESSEQGISDMVRLNVFDIEDNPFQPRREFGQPEIASLAESLKEHDMLQPILVRKIGRKFQLISGERRLRAAIQAGWKTIPARIREADDRLVAELAIVENLQRKDLNPLEKALSFKRYLKEHNARQEDLSSRLKIDRSTVANLMRLLELPEKVQDQLRKTNITAGHARALLPLGEENEQIDFCNKIIKDGWSVRETERRVSEHLAEASPEKATAKKKKANPQIESLENQARLSLGTKVEIKATAKGSGKMVVHFKNQKEFQRIFEQVCREKGSLSRAA